MKRILFVGDLRAHSRSFQRFQAFGALGHDAVGISTAKVVEGGFVAKPPSLYERVANKLGYPADPERAGHAVVAKLAKENFDVLWIEKALCLKPSTLRQARTLQPNMALAFHSDDNMTDRHNQSAWFRRALPLYDLVGTHKSFNTRPAELPAQGARKLFYYPKTFDPRFHRPVSVDEKTREKLGAPVGFIGTFEDGRARSMLELARAGIRVRVWGNGWGRFVGRHENLVVENRPIYGEEYVCAIAAMDINLGYLRRLNRDLHTDRSVEIPACGAFLLAERSSEHLDLFEEHTEACYFEGQDELLRQVEYYLEHADEREAVARGARERALLGEYTHDVFIARMLSALDGGPYEGWGHAA